MTTYNNNKKDNRTQSNKQQHQSAGKSEGGNRQNNFKQFQSKSESIAVRKAKENHFINYGENDRDFVITYNNAEEFKEVLQRNCAKYRLAMDEVNEQALYRPKRWLQIKNTEALPTPLQIRRLPPKPPTLVDRVPTTTKDEDEKFAIDSLEGDNRLPGGGGKMPAPASPFERGKFDMEEEDFAKRSLFGNLYLGDDFEIEDDKLFDRIEGDSETYLLPLNLNDRNFQSFCDSLMDHRASMCNFIYQRLSDQLYEKITLQMEVPVILKKNNSLGFYRVVVQLCNSLRSDDAGTSDLMEFHSLRCGKDITGKFTTSYPDFLQQWQAKLRVLNMVPDLKPNPTLLMFQFQIAIMNDPMFKDVINDITRRVITTYEQAKRECDIIYTAFERKNNLRRQSTSFAQPHSRYERFMQIQREDRAGRSEKGIRSYHGDEPEGEKVMSATDSQPICKRGCRYHPPHITEDNCWSKDSTCSDCKEKGHKTGAPMCKKRRQNNNNGTAGVDTGGTKMTQGEKRRLKIANLVEERATALLEEKLAAERSMSGTMVASSQQQLQAAPRPTPQYGGARAQPSSKEDADDTNSNSRVMQYWHTGGTSSRGSLRCLYDCTTHSIVAGIAAQNGINADDVPIALIDSGCSAHVISSPDLLTEAIKLNEHSKRKYGCETANGQTFPTHLGYIDGIGKAMVLPPAGTMRPLNLISEALLVMNGVYIKTGPKGKEIFADEDMTLHLLTVPSINNIYPVRLAVLCDAMLDARAMNDMRAKDQMSDENAQFNFANYVGTVNSAKIAALPHSWEHFFVGGTAVADTTTALDSMPLSAQKPDVPTIVTTPATIKPFATTPPPPVKDGIPHPALNLYYSKREFKRAWSAYQLHQLNHMSYDALANAVENGHIVNTNLTRKDFDNALNIYGPCVACLTAKFRYPSLYMDPRGTTGKGELVAIDLLPVDNPQLGGYTQYIVSVDEYTKYIFIVGVKSKESRRHLVAGLKKLQSHYITRGNCTIQRFHPDSEACLTACEDAVAAVDLPFTPSPPHIKQKQVERQVQTIKGRMRAIQNSMDKELPGYLYGQCIIAMAQEHNRLPELESGGPSPDVLFLGERFDLAVHHPLPFGTPVVVYYPNYEAKPAIAVSMSTQAYGVQKFYVRETHRIVVRHHKMVRQIDNIPESWKWSPRSRMKVVQIRDADHAKRQRRQRISSNQGKDDMEYDTEEDDDEPDPPEIGMEDAERFSREYDTDAEEQGEDLPTLDSTELQPAPIKDPGGVGLRRSIRQRRPTNRPEYEYSFVEELPITAKGNLEDHDHANKIVYRMSFKKAKLKYPVEAVQSMEAEVKNLVDHDTGTPVMLEEIEARGERSHILDILVFLLEKFDHSTQQLIKLKSRICVMGNRQPETTYDKIYSPTVSPFISNVLLHCAARSQGKLFCCLLDIIGAWLNTFVPDSHPRMYLRVPPELVPLFLALRPDWARFVAADRFLYLQLQKFIYGLKQAGREYKEAFDRHVTEFGFVRSVTDECLYSYRHDGNILLMTLHGDDNLLIGNSLPVLGKFIGFLATKYDEPSVQMWPKNYCGAALQWDLANGIVYKHMAGKLQHSLEKLGYDHLKPVDVPYTADLFDSDPLSEPADRSQFMSGTMSFLWPSRVCRLDTNMPVAYLTTKNVKPTQQDVNKLKTVGAYYLGTLRYGLQLGEPNYNGDLFALSFSGLSDAGHGTHNDGKSHGGFFIRVGEAKSYIYVECGKIQVVTLSACDAETYIQVKCAKQLCFFETVFREVGCTVLVSKIYTDSLSGIKYFLRERPNRRMIHSIIRNNFLKQLITRGQIMMKWKPTGELEPDILTKVLARLDFLYKRDKIMVNVPLEQL